MSNQNRNDYNEDKVLNFFALIERTTLTLWCHRVWHRVP